MSPIAELYNESSSKADFLEKMEIKYPIVENAELHWDAINDAVNLLNQSKDT